jgi:hypothetical protein
VFYYDTEAFLSGTNSNDFVHGGVSLVAASVFQKQLGANNQKHDD